MKNLGPVTCSKNILQNSNKILNHVFAFKKIKFGLQSWCAMNFKWGYNFVITLVITLAVGMRKQCWMIFKVLQKQIWYFFCDIFDFWKIWVVGPVKLKIKLVQPLQLIYSNHQLKMLPIYMHGTCVYYRYKDIIKIGNLHPFVNGSLIIHYQFTLGKTKHSRFSLQEVKHRLSWRFFVRVIWLSNIIV